MDEICWQSHLPHSNSNSAVGLAKNMTVSLLTHVRSLGSLENLLSWEAKSFGDLPKTYRFPKRGFKEYKFRKKESYRKQNLF